MTIPAFALPLLLTGMQATTAPTIVGDEAPPIVVPTLPLTPPASATTTGTTAPNGQAAPTPPASGNDPIVVTAGDRSKRVDPLESVNVEAFDAVQSVDKAITGPVAMEYKKSVPGPLRSGLRNFLSNLQEPIVFLNYLLQLKPGKAAETVGRFGINSSLGLFGLFDTAKKKPFHLPRRRNGFGYTLGYYGVKPGPYLYLPLVGPTTLRDVTGRIVDLSVLPFAVGKPLSQPAYAIPTTVVRLLDERAEADEEIRAIREGDVDPYTAVKNEYLRTRQSEIDALRGKRAKMPADAPQARPAPSGSERPRQ
ncbi:MAG: VacJ family lipoprotein [Sphingobium sp.]|nr:VacJ family lipoprotein [Sphingobium sp.]